MAGKIPFADPRESNAGVRPQKSYLSLAFTLRGGAIAVPEKSPAKSIAFSRSVRFWQVI
jgi:hypothetical protein